ncbi:kinase [Thraustotheca clavata]|uniref:Kinase n=1 Tax=Thraustotheca clavata TaxID=74557 RepID=A0A1V9ZNC9_9STRA|nr:kinase [Thraustotheca clavata]
MSSLQSNDDLVIASDAIIIFLAQVLTSDLLFMVIATTHCDYGHMMIVMVFSVLGLLVNVFYWNIQAHGETYVMLLLSGMICIFITWELDLSHRKTFYQYYNAEKSNEVLRESLDTALELIIYNEYKAEEKAIVENHLKGEHIQDKLIPYHIPLEHLSLKRVIGKGGFGEVILADYFGTQVVLKRMHRHKITQQAIEEFTKEILIMCDLRHPNVVQFIGASWNTYSNIGFVLEYVGHGDLYFIIHDKSVAKSWSDPFHRIAVDTARGICYLHSKSIIHRDLKSTNVLISPTYSAKICDLGASKSMAELKENEKQVGTPLWTAPEVVLGKQFSPKSDVFAFGIFTLSTAFILPLGVILTELITRKLPYNEQKRSAFNIMLSVANDGLRPTLPPWLPTPLRQLIDSCLAQEPEDRPNMMDILKNLQKNAMNQLQATDQWTKVKVLVHERTYRTTSLSFELIQTAKAQAALEEYTKETNLQSSASDMYNRPIAAQSDARQDDLRSKIETELVSWD